MIELHPEYGHEMVRGIGFLGEARSAILHHHERLDGSGYPYGLDGGQIPEFARVVAVADAFDAMTSTRSYRRARPVAAALEELERCAGAQFDPRMVEALVRALGRHGWHPVVTADEATPARRVFPPAPPVSSTAAGPRKPRPVHEGPGSDPARTTIAARPCTSPPSSALVALGRHPLARPRRTRRRPRLRGARRRRGARPVGRGRGSGRRRRSGPPGRWRTRCSGRTAGRPLTTGRLQVVAVVVAASLVGCVPHVAAGTGRPPTTSPGASSPSPSPPSASNPSTTRAGSGSGPATARVRAAARRAARADRAVRRRPRRRHGARPYPAGRSGRCCGTSCGRTLGIGSAVCATGAVMALAVAVAGLWALPVFSPAAAAHPAVLPAVRRRADHLPADHRLAGPGHRDRRLHPGRARPARGRAQPGRRAVSWGSPSPT